MEVLSEAQVLDLRQRHMEGTNATELGRRFGLDPRQAVKVATGERYPEIPMPARWEPLCMDAEDLEGWRRLNRGGSRARRPCEDCPLDFAAEMRLLGRCNGSPSSVTEDDDMTEAIAVVLTAPCGSCQHRPVCGLRRQVEGLTQLQVAPPDVDEALHLQLAATIECDHYLRDKGVHRPMTSAHREAIRRGRLRAAGKEHPASLPEPTRIAAVGE
jgi:hypothetical protein